MHRPYRPYSLVAVCIAAFISSSCASNPKTEAADPITVSSVEAAPTRDQAAVAVQPGRTAGPAASIAHNDDNARFTLETAVRKAVSWHPSVMEAVSRLSQQDEVLNEARAGYLPHLSWGVNSGYDSIQAGRRRPTFDLSASQMIYDFGKVDGKVAVATAGIAGRRSQVLMAVDDLIRETAHAAIEIQRNNNLRTVARDQVEDTKAILDLVSSRTDQGASTRSDQLQAEARVQAAEATVLEIEAQSQRWASTLSALTGSARGMEPKAGVPGWLSSACESAEPDWSRVPAIMQADAERAAAVAQLGLSRAEAFPTVSLDAGVATDVTRIGSRNPDYQIGLSGSGSLYNGGESSARRNAASHALRSSEAARRLAQVEIRRSLMEASAQIDSMRSLLSSLSKRQTMMNETRGLYRSQYLELGTRTLLDLLNADQEFHAARFDEINTRHNLERLGLDCAYGTGRLRKHFALEGKSLHDVTL